LESGDFNALANSSTLTTSKFTAPTAPTGWYQLNLSPSNFQHINPASTTQFRVRFIRGDNGNRAANILSFFSGSSLTYPPQLIIEYMVP
jgi:hypothetical protein